MPNAMPKALSPQLDFKDQIGIIEIAILNYLEICALDVILAT